MMKDNRLTFEDIFRLYTLCQPSEESLHSLDERILNIVKRIERTDNSNETFKQLSTTGFERGELGGIFYAAYVIIQKRGNSEKAKELFLKSICYYAIDELYEDAARTVLREGIVDEAIEKCKAIGLFECADYITARSKK